MSRNEGKDNLASYNWQLQSVLECNSSVGTQPQVHDIISKLARFVAALIARVRAKMA